MVRAPFVDKDGVKRGAWSGEEDNKLRAYILKYGHWNWKLLPKFAGLARCGKSCRLRWYNYLKPGIKRGDINEQEQELIKKLHDEHGNKWSTIAAKLPGRTDNEIKNYWHTHYDKPNRSTRLSSSKVKKIKGPVSYLVSSNPTVQSRSEPKSDQVMYILESSSSITEFDSTSSLYDTNNINSSEENYLESLGSSSNMTSSFLFDDEPFFVTDTNDFCYGPTTDEIFQDDDQMFMSGIVNLEKDTDKNFVTCLDSFDGFGDSFWSEPFVLNI